MRCPEPEEWMGFLEAPDAAGRSGDLERHLAACCSCASAVEAARASLLALRRLGPASRALCPPAEELLDRRSARVGLHLALCPLCRDDLEDLEALQTAPDLELVVGLLRGALTVISQTISPVAEPLPAPATRGIAGPGAFRLARDSSLGCLTVEVAPGDRDRVSLSIALDPAPAGPAQVDLLRADRWLESRPLDRSGRLGFLDLEPGAYRIEIRTGGEPAVRLVVEVRPEPRPDR
ncbi:MAG: hypothetical protein HY815_28380 [Candidatus Riflebacteria bacterium]|nr:hypothetical protein [Candidatus Riflebacteria bacterium]